MLDTQTLCLDTLVTIDQVINQEGQQCRFDITEECGRVIIEVHEPFTGFPYGESKQVRASTLGTITLTDITMPNGDCINDAILHDSGLNNGEFSIEISDNYTQHGEVIRELCNPTTSEEILADTSFGDLAMLIAKAARVLEDDNEMDNLDVMPMLKKYSTQEALRSLRDVLNKCLE